MIKAIVYGYNKPDAEEKYKEYCRSNNIPCRLGEAILLSSMENPATNSERIRGYYNEVMNETVKLIGWDKKMFGYLYMNP